MLGEWEWWLVVENVGRVTKEKKNPSGVCKKGVYSNSILCLFCKCLIYKMYSFIRVKLKEGSKFICDSVQTSKKI